MEWGDDDTGACGANVVEAESLADAGGAGREAPRGLPHELVGDQVRHVGSKVIERDGEGGGNR
jgi:hypothetical protein